MEDGLLSLKWNNHKSTFFHILSTLRQSETYTDVTLACDGKFFPVHKLVLSTCSDYFSEVFKKTDCKNPVVILKDINHKELEALLDYMYLGEVDVKQTELAALIKSAECLKIKGLAVPDEDPTVSKRSSKSNESKSSPPPKRHRRSSGSSIHKSQRTQSPSNISSKNQSQSNVNPITSHVRNSSSPPSQSVRTLPAPSTDESDLAKAPVNSGEIPIEVIKVEADDRSNSDSLDECNLSNENTSNYQPDRPPDSSSSLDIKNMNSGAENFNEYSQGDIDKEEHMDGINSYDESDPMAGPSGVQGSQMVNWNEEDGVFPHNLFGQDETAEQQVETNVDPFEVFGLFHGRDLDRLPSTTAQIFHLTTPPGGTPGTSNAVVPFSGEVKNHLTRSKPRARDLANKPYICTFCYKPFVDKSKWNRHMLAHTGAKPFSCSICERQFSRKDNLRTHMKCTHRIFNDH